MNNETSLPALAAHLARSQDLLTQATREVWHATSLDSKADGEYRQQLHAVTRLMEEAENLLGGLHRQVSLR